MKRLPVVLLLAAACASPPEIERPELDVELPRQWTAPHTETANLDWEWWASFNDESLNRVVRLALEHNYDIRAAAARLDQAEALARIAGADLEPGLDLNASARRARQVITGLKIPGSDVLKFTNNSFGVSLDLSWELDLWGRIRSQAGAALADFQAAEADLYGLYLSIAGQTVKAWLAVAEAYQQMKLAQFTVESFQDSADQVRSRYERGLRPSLDLRLSLSSLEDAKSLLEESRRAYNNAIRQLEVLLGQYPGREIDGPSDMPLLTGAVPAGLPADLIARRPDLAAAERRLAASKAREYAAQAALYPRISLTASGGTTSEEVGDLIDGDFSVWSLAGNLTQPLFQGGRLRANVDLEKARVEEILALYVGTVLNAYNEVESALTREKYLAEQVVYLERAAGHAEAARLLAESRYQSGLEDYIAVLESQRRSLSTQSRLINLRRLELDNRVNLYLALGGGFRVEEKEDVPVYTMGETPVEKETTP
jgi:NodT family efflux transporter outer membrane factor (OMF) lipoprotein